MTKQTFYFVRLHPNRAQNVVAKEFHSLNGTINGAHYEFLKALTAWNRDGKGEWVYWETSQDAYEEYRASVGLEA